MNKPHPCKTEWNSFTLLNLRGFSLVEAMIILVLISVAVMALIPLINTQTSIPTWKGRENYITYGTTPNDRVGIGSIPDAGEALVPVNPYNPDIGAKFATNTIAMNASPNKNSIIWGDRFITSRYTAGNSSNNSILIGMNTCNNTAVSSVIIRGETVAAEGNLLDCNGRKYNININDNIIQRNETIALGFDKRMNDANSSDWLDKPLARHSIIFLSKPSGQNSDIFRINYPTLINEATPTEQYKTAMSYNGKTNGDNLEISDNMIVAGDLYLTNYHTSTSNTNINNYNLKCDEKDGACDETRSERQYLNQSNGHTFNDNHPLNWILSPSDIRLKNIISDYNKGINDISKIDTYKFTYKNDKKQKTYIGIIAQKLIGILDEALHKDAKGYYSYEKAPLLYALTNSAKDIDKKQTAIEKSQKQAQKDAEILIKMYK